MSETSKTVKHCQTMSCFTDSPWSKKEIAYVKMYVYIQEDEKHKSDFV